jgi:cyclic pyranopterin phosphate synthase
MTTKIINIVDHHAASSKPATTSTHTPFFSDTRGRVLRDLRISVTDRCNFRCTYCMPKSVFGKDYIFLPQTELLNFDEITRMATLFAAHGVEKIRLTGGEPLLRKNIDVLIQMLSAIKTIDYKP